MKIENETRYKIELTREEFEILSKSLALCVDILGEMENNGGVLWNEDGDKKRYYAYQCVKNATSGLSYLRANSTQHIVV